MKTAPNYKLYVMKPLPPAIVKRAYASPGAKELAWRRIDLPEALEAICATQQAVLGGEVWLVRNPNENWHGLVPDRKGGPDGVWSWDTVPRLANESWPAYCERTYRESLNVLSEMNVEESAREDVVSYIWFNITYVDAHDV